MNNSGLKYRVTVEYISGEKTDVIHRREYTEDEIQISWKRHLAPRYDVGTIQPVGFLDSGHDLLIDAKHKISPPAWV